MPVWWVAFTGSRTTYIRSLRIQLSNLLLSLVSFGLGQDEYGTSAAVVDHVILYYFYPAILPVVRRWSSYPHRLMIPPHPSRHEAQANHVSQDAQPLPDPDVAVLLQARCLGGDFGGTDLRISSIDIYSGETVPG